VDFSAISAVARYRLTVTLVRQIKRLLGRIFIMKPKRFSSDRFNSRRPARLVASGTTKSRERLCSQAKISAAPIPPEVIQKSSIYTCSACQKPIKKDKYLLKACEKYWHEGCLKCDRCHGKLGELGTTFFQKSDMNLCRQDYLE